MVISSMIYLILTLIGLAAFSQEAPHHIFSDPARISRISIQLEVPGWQDSLLLYKDQVNNRRLVGDVSIDGKHYQHVGIRYKGNSSFNAFRKAESPKLPFNLKANYVNKAQTFSDGLVTLKLSNFFRDPSYLREVLGYKIAADYMPVPRLSFARLYANEAYIGLYQMVEGIDDPYLERHFGESGGAFFKCDPDFKNANRQSCAKGKFSSLEFLGDNRNCYRPLYEKKSKRGWSALIRLIDILNHSPDSIETVLNVDATLWYLALNNIIVNLDSYLGVFSHNYYLYQDATGRFQPLLWDLNLAFGGFTALTQGPGLENRDLVRLSPIVHLKEKIRDRPLVTQLLKDRTYRHIYIAHMRTILDDWFFNEKYLHYADSLHQIIAEDVRLDVNAQFTYADFRKSLHETVKQGEKRSIMGIGELMAQRLAYLGDHPLINRETPEILEVGHNAEAQPGMVTIKVLCAEAESVQLFYRTSGDQAFSQVEMRNNDHGLWKDTFATDTVQQYYIMAVSERAVRFAPRQAAFRYFTVMP